MSVPGDSVQRSIDVEPSPVYAGTAVAAPDVPKRRYAPIPSLDGLRAIAVIIVVLSHTGYGNTIPGGLGVTIFFFLSGYLITTLILDEKERRGQVNIKHFYFRRAYRLLPPLLITLLIAYTLVGLHLLDGGVSFGGLFSQLFYFANYFNIFFANAHSQPGGTGILWSLAVEEHFYFLFPAAMYLAFRYLEPSRMRKVLIRVFVFVCLAALAWRCWLVAQPGFNELRTYYATDTRFDSILFGCLLALWRNPARIPSDPDRPAMRVRDWLLCALGLALLLSTILYRNAEFRESLRYSLQGLALLPIFYYAVRFPKAGPFRFLNLRFLARVGVLSYGIYLIHDVIVEAMASDVHVAIPSWARFAIVLSVSIAFASFIDRRVDPYFRRKRSALH
jgi:peptidoglycan/LPS O-acetylase OafA/YrhL